MADKNDLPENLTDLPNMSTWEQYNGVNVGGTHYSPSEMNNTLRTVAQKGTSEPTIVYMSTPAGGTNANGQTVGKPEWSLNPYSMTLKNSSVTLDTDTGDIKVSAPQVVLDSLQVKSWQDSGVLKQLSSYYKRNPDSKLKNPLDSSDKGEYTPEQLVEKFNEAITKTAEEVTKQQNIKRDLYNQTYVYGDGEKWAQIASSLTPEDFVIMGASPWRESAKGTDLLAIPKSLYPIFKDVDGFNAETGTISKDDFLSNYYNLSKTSDKDISNLTDWYKEYMAHGDYLGDDGIDTDEYARWQAFNAFTSNVSPTTDPANWIRRTTSDVFASAGNAGLEVIYSIGSLVEGGLNWATGGDATGMQEAYQWRQEESEKYTEYASRLTSVGGAISGLTTFGADMVIDFIVTDVAIATGGAAIGAVGGAIAKTGRTITNLVKGANKSGKVLGTTQKVTELLEGGAVTTEAILTAEKGLAAGAKVASEDERLVALTRVLGEAATKATAATTEVAEAATTVARDGLKTISTAQKISRAGASLVSGGEAIASGASAALRAQTEAGKGAEFLNAYIETARQMQNVSRTSNATLSLARLTAESVVSAAIWEPDAVRGLLEGDYSEENKEALLLNIAFDAGVFGALRLGGALAREASLTPTGQVLTAYGQKGTNWLAVHTHDLNNKVHTAIWGQDWITNIKSSSKKRARQINEILNESRRPLATEKRMKGEDVWAFVKRQNTNAVRHAAVQNAIDNLERGAKGSAMRFLQKSRNAKLNGYENNLRDISNKMYKAERKLGIGSKRRIFGQVDPQNDTVRLFSEHTANYLGARQQLAVLDAIEEKLGSLSPEQEKGRGLLQEMYDAAVERMGGEGSELVNLADQFYVENARWWREFNDARVAEGLLNADDINSLRESGLWGENGELYQRTGRVKGEPTYVVTRADGSFKRGNVTELESYVWGSADSFADPTVVRYDALLEAGGELNSRELRDAVANIPGMKMEQVLSAEQTEAVKNVKQWRKDFASMMKSAERDVFKKTFSENGVMGTLVDKKLMRQEIGRAQREQDKAAAKVTRAEQKEVYRQSASDRTNYINSMDDSQIDEFLRTHWYSWDSMDETNWGEYMDTPGGTSYATKQKLRGLQKEMLERDPSLTRSTMAPSGEMVTPSMLPKIKTSDYVRVTGYARKDAGDMKRFLSEENGRSLDDASWSELFPARGEGEGSTPVTADDILEFYQRVVDNSRRPDMNRLTFENYQAAREWYAEVEGVDINLELNRTMATTTPTLRDLDSVKTAVNEQKAANAVFEAETNLNEKSRVLEELLGKEAVGRLDVQIGMKMNEGIDEFVRTVAEDKATQKTLKGIFDAYGISEAERGLNAQYIILRELQKDWSDFEKATYGYFARQAQTAISVEPSLAGQTDRLTNEFQEMFKSRVQSRVDDLSARLADAKSPLLDYEHLYSEIGKLDNEIRGAKKSINNRGNVIAYQNREGRVEYYRVDPAVADLYNFDAAREEIGSVGKLFNISAKIYRLSTTGVNIKSFVSQSFRDSINAFVGGNMAATFGRAATKLEREFGDRIVGDLRGYSPEFSRNLDALAEQSGKAVEGEAVGFLGEEATRLAPGSTETEAYKQTRNTGRQLDATAIDRVENGIDRVTNKLGSINEKRERYIRKTVYMNAVYDALKRGYSTQEAMTMAQFVMNNASTNFSRTLVHLGKLSRSVPYLGAAVNGTKSFWRLFSIDPVGVASRFIGGVAIPVMGLTALTLSDPETREKYKNLNEYEKDEFLIFGANGQLIKIPLPQEFSAITNPFRQMVEMMYDADNKTFWEFCLHDAVQAVPYNLDGFFEVDANDFLGDDNIFNRMATGTLGLLSGITPRPIVAAITAFTGRDMYTGKLLDNDYVVWDEESESWVKATNSNSELATVIAENVGGSAGVLGEVLDSLFGETGMDVVNTLTTLFTKGAEATGSKLVDVTAGRLVKPMTVEDYDRNKARWNRSLAELYNQKESIIGSDKWQKNEQAINMAESDEARKKYLSARNDMLADWYKNVENTIKNLTEADPNGFDRYRQAAVLSLLNTKHTVSGLSAATREAQQQLYYEGKNEAIDQLVKWGASTSDQSILGYIDKNGEVKINTPLEILAAQNVVYSQASLAQSNLEVLLEQSGTDYAEQKKAVNSQISAIYNRKGTIKDKLTDDDYDEIENLQLAWNARVMAAVAPYIQQVGPEVALNSQDTLDYLRKFFLVPSDYKLDKKGYRVSDTSLAGGDSDEAYIREYIKAAFGMNDTSWGGGKNYSTRATLGAGSE